MSFLSPEHIWKLQTVGKAKIISGGTNGLYQIEVQRSLDRLKKELTRIDAAIIEFNTTIPALQVAALDAKSAVSTAEHDRDLIINNLNSGGGATLADVQKANQAIYPLIKKYIEADRQYKTAKLELLELQKRKTILEAENQPPTVQAAWCADFSENISIDAMVSTLEPNGEGIPIIKPANNGNTFDLATDGQVQPVLSSGPNATWFNWAILPGWQKFKPTYRAGIITSMIGDLADIALDAALSSAQNLDINQTDTLENVPIEYMDCNGGAFETGDRVIIEFTDQDWAQPKVIGFESNPKPCAIDNFVCWPISDAAESGWGLPSIDGFGNPINPPLGTVGGTSPWVNIQTQNYNLLRFQDYLVGNIYWKSSDSEIPILSWLGPKNGYLLHTKYLSSYNDYVGAEDSYFGDTLYAMGKVIAQVTGRHIAGAAIKKTGETYRLYIMVHFSYYSRLLRLLHADIDDLLFNSPITSFTEYEFPSDNTNNPYSAYTSGTVVAFNQNATHAAWCADLTVYEMHLESKAITATDGAYTQDFNPTPAEGLQIERDVVESNFVDYYPPGGGVISAATTLDVTEQSSYAYLSGYRSSIVLAVDYKNNALVKLERSYIAMDSFEADYHSHRTHTRVVDEFNPPDGWGQEVDDYTASSSHITKEGVGFRFNGIDIIDPNTSSSSGSFQHPDGTFSRTMGDNYTGIAEIRIAYARSNDSNFNFSDAYLRFMDLKSNTLIYTKNGFSGTDTESGNAYVRHQVKFNNGSPVTFLDQSSGLTALENWVKVRPETEQFDIKYASDRYGNRHLCSITQANIPLLNYISNGNLVQLLSIAGANPRFNKIGVI